MRDLGRMISLVILMLLLLACATSPPVRYYSLEPVNLAGQADAEDSPIVALGPLRMPDYLKRPQMVTRDSGAQINVDDFARWAEPVDQVIHGVIATNLDSLLDDVIVVAYPYINAIDPDYWIRGRVDQFDADETGEVVLFVQWAVIGPGRKIVVAPQRRRYQTQASNPEDPDAIAQAMSQALAEFSRDISTRVGAVWR